MVTGMSQHALHSFFHPERIAVFGATPKTEGIRGRFLEALLGGGYGGEVLPINPSHKEVHARRCHATIIEAANYASGPIDLAVIAIPASGVPKALEQCASAKVRNVLILSSGFAEESDERANVQSQIAALGRDAHMRIVGPNSEGFLNVLGRVSATFSPTVELAWGPASQVIGRKRVASIAQSGGVGFGMLHRALKAGIQFSYAISTGNEADITAADCLEYMLEDANTDVLVLFLESIRDVPRFDAACARARELNKPIVAIKVGRSEAGKRATQSHTASIAGFAAAYDAFFAKHGIIACNDLSESTAILGVLTTCHQLRGNRVAVLTPSGGSGALISDTLERHGFKLPIMSEKTQQSIRAMVPSYATAQNPVDVTAGATRTGASVKAANILLNSGEIDLLVTVHSMTSETSIMVDPRDIARPAEASGVPVTAFCYTDPSNYARGKMIDAGIYVHADAHLMGTALARVLRRTEQIKARHDGRVVAIETAFAIRAVDAVKRAYDASPARVLCEYEVNAMLAECGIETSRDALCRTADEAVAAAERLGYPVALKIQSPAIMHKTEVGGVKLGLDCAAAVRDAYRSVMDAARVVQPHAPINGVLVQKMAPPGYEVIVGVINDTTFGPLVMVGLGGIAVELFKDVAYGLAPLSAADAQALLQSLKSSALFDGFRGKPRIDLAPLAELIARISWIASAAHKAGVPIADLELNPVIVHADGSGYTIADALLQRGG
jgi:acyl-CoA synthetase (NDP forming)